MGAVVPLPRRPEPRPGTCPTCFPYGSPGWMPVVLRATHPANPYGYDVDTLRPCERCRPERYEAWRNGTLRAKQPKQSKTRS